MYVIKAKSSLFGHVVHAVMRPCKHGYYFRVKLSCSPSVSPFRCSYGLIVEDIHSAIDYLCDDLSCDFLVINNNPNANFILP